MKQHIDINIGKLCNNACIFCSNGEVPPAERPWVPAEVVHSETKKAAAAGFGSIGFLGGEITVYPHALDIIRAARGAGFERIVLCTNGRRLAGEKTLEEFLQAGVTRMALSIHSHRPEIEDRICGRRGAFRQKLAAIDNLVARRDRLPDGFSLNCCIHGWNVDQLAEMVGFFRRRGVDDIRLNSLRPEHKAVGSSELVPSFGRVMKAALAVIERAKKTKGFTVTFGDIPLCLWPEDFLRDQKRAGRFVGELRDFDAWVTVFRDSARGGQADRFSWRERRRDQLKTRLPVCGYCPAREFCEGPWARYVEIHGSGEFGWQKAGGVPQLASPRKKQGRRRRLHIMVSNYCNNHCRFCLEDRDERREADFSDQLKALEQYPSREEVLFTCGEPTLNPRLADWIKLAAGMGYQRIELVTNGRRLAYPRLAEELVQAGLTAVTVSLHCHLEDIHDRLTQARGSCAQTLRALSNMVDIKKRLGRPRITTSTVVTRINLDCAADTIRFLDGLGVDCMVVNYVEPVSEALAHFDELVPRMTQAAEALAELAGTTRAELKIEGLPLCLLRQPQSAGDREIIIIWREGRLRRLRPTRQQRKGPPCRQCAAGKTCEGVWIEYYRRFGWGEFRPIKQIGVDSPPQ